MVIQLQHMHCKPCIRIKIRIQTSHIDTPNNHMAFMLCAMKATSAVRAVHAEKPCIFKGRCYHEGLAKRPRISLR